ncbi:MAG: hemerythrin domain-containing protein [Rubrivivax sp.]
MPTDPLADRPDLYAAVHKGLRLFMADTLVRLGRLDAADAEELRRTLDQLAQLLQLYAEHTRLENDHLHTALEARRPGISARIGSEHLEHAEALGELQAEAAALPSPPPPAALMRLYRRYSRFVAMGLEHMAAEESRHNAALWELLGDDELLTLQQRLQAALSPQRLALLLRWMLPALNPAERERVLARLDPPTRTRLLDTLRPRLDEPAWARLHRALGLPPVPGLVEV